MTARRPATPACSPTPTSASTRCSTGSSCATCCWSWPGAWRKRPGRRNRARRRETGCWPLRIEPGAALRRVSGRAGLRLPDDAQQLVARFRHPAGLLLRRRGRPASTSTAPTTSIPSGRHETRRTTSRLEDGGYTVVRFADPDGLGDRAAGLRLDLRGGTRLMAADAGTGAERRLAGAGQRARVGGAAQPGRGRPAAAAARRHGARRRPGIYLPLEGDDVSDATFAPPDPATAGDSVQARLLRDAVRLNFRAGAGPFRSLGRIAVEPRAYQLVPLLMALKLDPVRLLIADDVGIGKTIEALLIARELLDRGEIARLAVICPPHLCDQWQAELAEKFGIEAEVVRPGTVARLERGLPTGRLALRRVPVRGRLHRLHQERPPPGRLRARLPRVRHRRRGAHRRRGRRARRRSSSATTCCGSWRRIRERHLILTTATPHSGVEAAFRSLLTLLDPAFADLPQDERLDASDPLRQQLAQHFVQRRRADIRSYLEDETVFPERKSARGDLHAQPGLPEALRATCWPTPASWCATPRARRRSASASAGGRRWRCCAASPPARPPPRRRSAPAPTVWRTRPISALNELDALGERAVLDLDSADAADGDDVVPGSDTVEGDGAGGERAAPACAPWRARPTRLRGDKDRKLLAAGRDRARTCWTRASARSSTAATSPPPSTSRKSCASGCGASRWRPSPARCRPRRARSGSRRCSSTTRACWSPPTASRRGSTCRRASTRSSTTTSPGTRPGTSSARGGSTASARSGPRCAPSSSTARTTPSTARCCRCCCARRRRSASRWASRCRCRPTPPRCWRRSSRRSSCAAAATRAS